MLDLTKLRPKVALASPSTGSVTDAHLESVLQLFGYTNPDKYNLKRRVCRGSNIAENQNTLVDAARDWGADYMFFTETDVAFPKHALEQLMSHDKDIIGASTQYKEHDLLAANIAGSPRLPRYMGYELDGTEIELNSLTQGEPIRKVAGIPMGLTLIKMSAIETVSRYVAEMDGAPAGMRGPPFFHKNTYIEGKSRGIISTTDMSFCGTARAAGLDVWLDARLSLQTEHIGTMNFSVIPPLMETAA